MARTNVAAELEPIYTHEGAVAQRIDEYRELRRSVMTCLLWEDTFYESGKEIAARIAELIPKVDPQKVADLAIEARTKMQLRHAPLFMVRELARIKGTGKHVERALTSVIQRADELGEFAALYWKQKRQPFSSAVKRGLASAFIKFNAYALAKYNRDNGVKLRDVLFLCHAKPKDQEQAAIWKQLIAGTLEAPDTWEVALSAGKDKKETFERLLTEGKLGGLAMLRNLRNMIEAGVDQNLIRMRLSQGIERALPFRFIAAAKHAPKVEDAISGAMLMSVALIPKLLGRTLLVVDTSASMGGILSEKSEMTRIDAAAGLGILVREVCEDATLYATAGDDFRQIHATMELPVRHGLPMADAIRQAPAKIGGGGIFLVQAMDFIASKEKRKFDRVIVLTDEQDCDRSRKPEGAKRLGHYNYVVNMASYKNGVSYRNGWEHIDGWSEHVLDYIRETESIQQ
jgi:hypothetical protein